MEYLKYNEESGWDFSEYFGYLTECRSILPEELFEFFFDERRYNMESHDSLHDSWVEFIAIKEPSSGSRHEIRAVEIHVGLLGPYHDKKFVLKYSGVSNYELSREYSAKDNADCSNGHGDLLVHELSVKGPHRFCHTMLFSTGRKLVIEFRTFAFEAHDI